MPHIHSNSLQGPGLNFNPSFFFFFSKAFPRIINRTLGELSVSWNNHPLSTERNRSPRQLWHSGMSSAANSDYLAVRSVFADDEEMNEFGTGGGTIPDCNSDNDVQVPEALFALSDEQLEQYYYKRVSIRYQKMATME